MHTARTCVTRVYTLYTFYNVFSLTVISMWNNLCYLLKDFFLLQTQCDTHANACTVRFKEFVKLLENGNEHNSSKSSVYLDPNARAVVSIPAHVCEERIARPPPNS